MWHGLIVCTCIYYVSWWVLGGSAALQNLCHTGVCVNVEKLIVNVSVYIIILRENVLHVYWSTITEQYWETSTSTEGRWMDYGGLQKKHVISSGFPWQWCTLSPVTELVSMIRMMASAWSTSASLAMGFPHHFLPCLPCSLCLCTCTLHGVLWLSCHTSSAWDFMYHSPESKNSFWKMLVFKIFCGWCPPMKSFKQRNYFQLAIVCVWARHDC